MVAVLSSLHSPPRPLKERPLCSVKPAGSQQGPGRDPPTGRNQAPAIHSPNLTPVIRRVQKQAPREGREGLRVTQHVGGCTSQLLFYPRFTDKKTEAPKPRLCPGAASTSWGPAAPPARPGQARAKKPRRLETGEARRLVRSLPWRCEGSCLLVSVPGPRRPLYSRLQPDTAPVIK